MKPLFGKNNNGDNIAFSRADTSVLGIWWWTIDRCASGHVGKPAGRGPHQCR